MTESNLHGWMAPNGDFNPASIGKSHSDEAVKMLGRNDAVQLLNQQGWLRVTYLSTELIANNDLGKLTQQQISALKDMAVTNRMTSIEFDSGDTSRVIWSASDAI